MRFIIILLLLVGAHFALTANAPAAAGQAWFLWPFAADSKPAVTFLGSTGSTITHLLSVIAGASFLAAVLSLFGWIVPAEWWLTLVVVAAVSSIALYVLYFGLWAILPMAVDVLLLWGVLAQHWSVAELRGV